MLTDAIPSELVGQVQIAPWHYRGEDGLSTLSRIAANDRHLSKITLFNQQKAMAHLSKSQHAKLT